MRRLLPLALLAGLGAAAVMLQRVPFGPRVEPESPTRRGAAPALDAAGSVADSATMGAGFAGASAAPARPRSLRGTRADGGLAVDEHGRFVPTIDARRLFDYVLTGSGELPPDALRARIVYEIERRLALDAAQDATALLDRYLAYRERVRAFATDGAGDGGDLDARLETLIALRREMLGPEAAEAFFADEEADARQLLEVRRLMRDPALSEDERAARVAAVEAARDEDLPPEVQEARRTARTAATLRAAEAELHARNAGPDEIRALRERLAGPEAAARLAELDQRRAAWQARVDVYRSARERIANDPSLPPDERLAADARLLNESFTPPERLRVQALDEIDAATH